MKHTLRHLFVVCFVLFAVPWARPAFAMEKIAGSTASLVSHAPVKDPRITHLEGYLEYRNGELVKYASHFVSEADRLNLDWRLVAAIAGVESTFCRFIPTGSFNCWGWGIPTGAQSGIGFAGYRDGITQVSEGLRTRYFGRGRVTLDQVGSMYAASPLWAAKVRFFIRDIDEFKPASSKFTKLLAFNI